MGMADVSGYAGRSPSRGALALAAGLCVTAAWFLPWCTMRFGTTPAGGAPSSPIAQSPYALAARPAGWQAAWLVLLVGLALVGLGVYHSLARRSGLTRTAGDALVLTLAAGALVATTYRVLGLMAVPQILTGHAAPGVYLVPALGAAIMLAGLGLVAIACVQAWRQL